MGALVRAFRDHDYAILAPALGAITPAEPHTEGTLRHLDRYLAQRGMAPARVVAVDARGRLLGHGLLVGRGASPGAEVGVLPSARRRGVGTALLAELEQLATDRDAVELRTRWVAEDDAAALGFLARHGFRERERAWPSTLEVAAFDPSGYAGLEERLAGEGIAVTTLVAEGQDESILRRVCALQNACLRDIPRRDEHQDIPYGAWVSSMVEGPNAMPEALFLAVDGGAYVGMSALDRRGPAGTLDQGFTGVLPSHRGRGIATALKLRVIAHARELGVRAIRTRQHAGNAPMLHVNARLGFRRGPADIRFEKPLARSGPSTPGNTARPLP